MYLTVYFYVFFLIFNLRIPFLQIELLLGKIVNEIKRFYSYF